MTNEEQESKLREELERGQQAKQLLEHPMLVNALAQLEKDTVRRLKEAPVRDREGQHELVLMLKVADKFKSDLKNHVKTGELAKFGLIDLAKKATNIFKLRS